MQEGNKKKKWGKPKLIILIRGKPEEGVLGFCKAWDYYSTGSTGIYQDCTLAYTFDYVKGTPPSCTVKCNVPSAS